MIASEQRVLKMRVKVCNVYRINANSQNRCTAELSVSDLSIGTNSERGKYVKNK